MHTYMHTYIHSRTNMFVQSRRQISGRTLMHATPKFAIIAALLSLLATSSKILKTLHAPWFTCSKVEWKSPTPWQALRRVRTALRQRTGCSLHRIQSKTRSSCSDSKHDRVEIVGDPHLTSEPRWNVWRNALFVIASASGRAGFARGSTARSRARISMCCRRARRDFALSAKASTPAVEPHRGGQIGHRHTIHARTFRYTAAVTLGQTASRVPSSVICMRNDSVAAAVFSLLRCNSACVARSAKIAVVNNCGASSGRDAPASLITIVVAADREQQHRANFEKTKRLEF